MDISKYLDIHVENVADLDPEAFALSRKDGLGASDASVYLHLLDHWTCVEDMMRVKNSPQWLDEEKEIGLKPNVRKGKELEPMILQKFREVRPDVELIKPPHTYRHREYPYLTVNFDGVIEENGQLIPVEAKYVTTFADKMWKEPHGNQDVPRFDDTDPVEYITKLADYYGVPAYYLPQMQQQILMLDAPYGYLIYLSEKTWNLRIYRIPAISRIKQLIVMEGYKISRKMSAYMKREEGTK